MNAELLKLIAETRELRLKIARKRTEDFAERYPEAEIAGVKPLDDETVIKFALERELAHQTRVASDLGMSIAVERGR